MIIEEKICKKIIKLPDDNAKLKAIPVNRRTAPNIVARIKQMEGKLALTFSLRPVNVENKIKNKEDLLFVQLIRSDCLATFRSYDKSLGQKVKRQEQRLQLHDIRRTKIKREISSNILLNDIPNPTNDFDEQSNMDDMKNDAKRPSTSIRNHHRNKRTGTNLFIPL